MVTVVVDGFYGSSGKGKMCVHLAKTDPSIRAVVRCGGPNAGHTSFIGDKKLIFRQIPTAAVLPNVALIIAAGAMVDVSLLAQEIQMCHEAGIGPLQGRLFIDNMAAIVEQGSIDGEKGMELGRDLGSTQTGTGWTASQRALRSVKLARDIPELKPYLADTVSMLNAIVDGGNRVVVEGTQGFGLSLSLDKHYPYCTSKNCDAATFLAECGLSPRVCDQIVAVYRTYPIRVGGNSGPMFKEIDWETIRKRSGRPESEKLIEMTSVTKKVRRVGEWDWNLFRRSIMVNRPTHIAIHGLDYLNYKYYGCTNYEEIITQSGEAGQKGAEAMAFLHRILDEAPNAHIMALFTGPHQNDLVDTRTGAK